MSHPACKNVAIKKTVEVSEWSRVGPVTINKFAGHGVLINLFLTIFILFGVLGCSDKPANSVQTDVRKIGVLLVNHGSKSKKWRDMLWDVEKSVRDEILADKKVAGIKTAFMEYTEPSIATRMKEFDEEGFDEVVIVPIFLTVSSHSLDDIPTIVGIKSDPRNVEQLKKEHIQVYRAKARVTITPTLDFTTLLKKNVLRRVKARTENFENTGVVLVAYGDKHYNQQWEEMMEEIGRYLKIKAGIDTVAYAWCGHLVDYSPSPTTEAVNKVFEMEDSVITVPLLVAFDPYFQIEIIQKGIEFAENSSKVIYKPDAILPDENLNRWVIDITRQTLEPLS